MKSNLSLSERTCSTIQKNDLTIQNSENTIQKNDSTIQKELDSSQQKVLDFFSEHPYATIEEAVNTIGSLSLGGVKFVIGKLQQKELLKRIGGRKQGEWQVISDTDTQISTQKTTDSTQKI